MTPARALVASRVESLPLHPLDGGISLLRPMKDGIHPASVPSRVSCACGNSFVTRSTRGDFQIDVCGACRPFYTGTQKLIDTAGRGDRFRKRYEKKAPVAKSAPQPSAQDDSSATK